MSISVVRSHPGRNCTGAAVGRLLLLRRSRFEGVWRSSGGCLLFGPIGTVVLPDLGLCSIADHLEGVRRFPNFSEKTVKFPAQKEHAQQTETGAKTKVNNWD